MKTIQDRKKTIKIELSRRQADLIDVLMRDLLSVSEDPSVTRDARAILKKVRNSKL
jgi:hypothetical protein